MTAQRSMRGDVAVLVPAAGSGVRMGPGAPKALRHLRGEPLLVHALRRVCAAASVAHVVVASPAESVDSCTALLAEFGPIVTIVAGGDSRQASVAAALAAAPDHLEIVLVHDAARALAPASLVEAVAEAVRSGHDAVVPALPVVDTIKQVSPDGRVVATIDRSQLRAIQTPQGFRRSVLTNAHVLAADDLTDDAGLVERMGADVWCIPGDPAAMKITQPFDLAVASLLLGSGQSD